MVLRIKIGVLLNDRSYLQSENKEVRDATAHCPICAILAVVRREISRSIASALNINTFSQLIRLKGISETVQLAGAGNRLLLFLTYFLVLHQEGIFSSN